tara:strand:+ start:3724 stop:4977 length:1254 start_codon:yes stop_codon:yes gene_type:complete
MKLFCKKKRNQTDCEIIDYDSNIVSNLLQYYKFNTKKSLDEQGQYLYGIMSKKLGVVIDSKSVLDFVINTAILKRLNHFIIEKKFLNDKNVHFLFLIGKDICVNVDNGCEDISEYLTNPIISHISCDPSLLNKIQKTANELTQKTANHQTIIHQTFFLDVNKHCEYVNDHNYKDLILRNIKKVFGCFTSYYIFNLDKELENTDIEDIYNTLSSNLGNIIKCRPVNNESISTNYTRDVKFIPNTNHFYSSNIMQPLHSDFAYFPYETAADYLTLFCYQKSEYGGITSLITSKKVKQIMKKYNRELYDKIIKLKFTYKSQVDDDGKFNIHEKLFLDEDTNYINWNNYQIKQEHNSSDKMAIKEEIYKFFDEIISKGYMYDINIEWERGDCILLNDHLNLHTRTSFLGERWLSGNAFFKK